MLSNSTQALQLGFEVVVLASIALQRACKQDVSAVLLLSLTVAKQARSSAPVQRSVAIKYFESGTSPSMASRFAKLVYVFQWAVLLLLCLPLLVLAVILSLPVATVLWVSAAVEWGRKLAAERDPVLAMALKTDSNKGRYPILARLAAFQRVYTSLVLFGVHSSLRLFVRMARPRVAFVVYTSNYSILRRFFCVGTAELGCRAGIHTQSM